MYRSRMLCVQSLLQCGRSEYCQVRALVMSGLRVARSVGRFFLHGRRPRNIYPIYLPSQALHGLPSSRLELTHAILQG